MVNVGDTMNSVAVNNLVVISDPHCGCCAGLCPEAGARRDAGGWYTPSGIQRKVWAYWQEFWNEWVPRITRGGEYAVVVNGDAVDGVHHASTTQISHDLGDQSEIAYQVLAPVVDACHGRLYMVRGTEAHVGPSGVEEERLAKRLGAVADSGGRHARFELWARVGEAMCHIMHHIGTTSSAAHESSAVNAELTAEFVEAARWGEEPPDFVVRSHRHRSIAVEIDTAKGYAVGLVTPGWQAKTPFAYRIAGARLAPPQFGGIVIRQGDEEFYWRRYVRTIGRPEVEVL